MIKEDLIKSRIIFFENKVAETKWAARVLVLRRALITYPLIMILNILGIMLFTKGNLNSTLLMNYGVYIDMIIGILTVFCTSTLTLVEKQLNFEGRSEAFKRLSIDWIKLKDDIQQAQLENEENGQEFLIYLDNQKVTLCERSPNIPLNGIFFKKPKLKKIEENEYYIFIAPNPINPINLVSEHILNLTRRITPSPPLKGKEEKTESE